MVQWTDKPAAKPQIASEERKPDTASPRPVLRKPRRRRLVGALQVLTICGVFGLILASYFTFKETRGDQAAATPERGAATARIVVMDRTQCRELGFDNQNGKMVHKGAVACHDTPQHDGTTSQSLYRHPTNRMDAVRRSFAQ